MSPRSIGITEITFRGAHQNLVTTRMATEDMVDVCEEMGRTDFWSMEYWGGVTFDACIRFFNEDPWERLQTFRESVPNSHLQMLLHGQSLLGYRHCEDVVVDKFVEKSTENGMDVFRVFDAPNDPRNLEHVMCAVENADKHAQGTICCTTSPLHDVDGYVKLAGRLLDIGADSIALKDMTALLRPQPAYDIIRGIRETYGEDTQTNVHCHSTTGVTMVTLMKAIEAGADVVDMTISSASLGPGHNLTESLVEMLKGTGYTIDLNMNDLITIRDHFRKVRPKHTESESKALANTDVLMSQVPGGMLSNMENQLKARDAGDRVDEVMREVPVVRKDAGYPSLVTPSSQIVGTQAVFNVLMGCYKVMTAEFADLMLSYYGQCLGERSPELIKQAAEQTKKEEITVRPVDLLESEWDDLVKEAKELDGYNGTAEDILTNALLPSVAPGFFTTRGGGPKSVDKTAERLKYEVEQTFGAASAIHEPIRYKVIAGGRSQTIQVEPA